MTTERLAFEQLPALAVAQGAGVPDPGLVGVWVWSTTLGKPAYWDGNSWEGWPAESAPEAGTAVFTANSSGGTNAGIADTWISTFEANSNKGTDPQFLISATDVFALLQLSDLLGVGGIPAGATVGPVEVDLCYRSAGAFTTTGDQVTARELLAPWNVSQATWNNRLTSTPWGTAGASGAGDQAAAVSSTFTFAAAGVDGNYYTIPSTADFVADVQAWVDASSNGNGWKFQSASFPNFHSSEATDGLRPIVRVQWSVAGSGGLSLQRLMALQSMRV